MLRRRRGGRNNGNGRRQSKRRLAKRNQRHADDQRDGRRARLRRKDHCDHAEGSEIATRQYPRLEMPRRKDRDWKGVIASLLVHAVILFLIVGPIIGSSDFSRPDVIGGGGLGPAGGGGGGTNGLGSREQHVEFVRVKSDPTTMPKLTPQNTPPVKTPEPKPPVESPVTPAQQVVAPELAASSSGAGTGNTNSTGA